MTSAKTGHFFVVPLAAWGHVRPLLHLSLNLLDIHRGLHLSLLVVPSVSSKIDHELALNFGRNGEVHEVLKRLQVLKVSSVVSEKDTIWDAEHMAAEGMDFAQTFPVAVKALYGEAELPSEKNKFAGLKPNFGIFDSFQSFVPAAMDAVAKGLGVPTPALFCFLPCNATAGWHHVSKGGYLDIIAKKVNVLMEKGLEPLEAYAAVGHGLDGRVVTIPGMRPMYDYEFMPQDAAMPVPPQIFMMICGMQAASLHPATTALVLPTAQELDNEAHDALEADLGKKVLQCGLQFPDRIWEGVKQPRNGDILEGDQKVLAFLDDMQAKFGDRSVAYVSFGSAWFPIARPELAVWLLESLIENNVPLLFAHATELFPQIPESILDVIKKSPNAHSVRFAPQWQVLAHPATKFFVSHSGSNSSAEAILAGVPVVSMPFGADQAEFAYMLVENGAAIQLKQVSSFSKKEWTKLYDGTEVIGTEEAIKQETKGVWEQMKGKKGDEMREKMLELRALVKKSRDEGKSRKAMESLEAYW